MLKMFGIYSPNCRCKAGIMQNFRARIFPYMKWSFSSWKNWVPESRILIPERFVVFRVEKSHCNIRAFFLMKSADQNEQKLLADSFVFEKHLCQKGLFYWHKSTKSAYPDLVKVDIILDFVFWCSNEVIRDHCDGFFAHFFQLLCYLHQNVPRLSSAQCKLSFLFSYTHLIKGKFLTTVRNCFHFFSRRLDVSRVPELWIWRLSEVTFLPSAVLLNSARVSVVCWWQRLAVILHWPLKPVATLL